MRKIVAGLFMSLDGVVEAPETWHFPYFNDEMGQIVTDQLAASDTMLLGRRTYEEFAASGRTRATTSPSRTRSTASESWSPQRRCRTPPGRTLS